MSYLIFALVLAFIAANVYVEAANQGPSKWWRDPLSHYLIGVRYAWLQRLAFAGMALAECLMIVSGYALPESIALGIAAAGLLGVVITKTPLAMRLPPRPTEIAHLTCAGFAFAAAVVFEFLVLRGTPSIWFPIGAVLGTGTLAIRAPEQRAITEKTLTAFVLAGMIPIVAIPL